MMYEGAIEGCELVAGPGWPYRRLKVAHCPRRYLRTRWAQALDRSLRRGLRPCALEE